MPQKHARRQFQPGFQSSTHDRSRSIDPLINRRLTRPVANAPGLADPLEEIPALPQTFAIRKKSIYPVIRWHKATPLAILGSLALLLLLLASLWLRSHANANVTLFQVQNQPVTQMIGGNGTLYPHQQVNLTYPLRERVLSVLVQVGDSVSSGQPLLHLDTSQSAAQMQQATENTAAAQAYLAAATSNGNALTIAQAQQQLSLAKSKEEALRTQLSYPLLHDGLLLSPLQGIITSITISAGEVLLSNTTLLVIMDESSLLVHMQVPLSNVGKIHPGQKAEIMPLALTNQTFSGLVNAVIPQANPLTETFEVWITVDDPQHLLLPGMNVFVHILLPSHALVIPRLSVMQMEQLATVFVVHTQHAYLHTIQMSGRTSNRVLVSSGLKQGDYIVLIGQDQLSDGQAVVVRAVERSNNNV